MTAILIPLMVSGIGIAFCAAFEIFSSYFNIISKLYDYAMGDYTTDEISDTASRVFISVGVIQIITPVLSVWAYLYVKGMTFMELVDKGI
jgi:hypothetical protein